MTAENLAEIDAEDLPTEYFRPRAVQVAGSIGLILTGLLITAGIARIGGQETS